MLEHALEYARAGWPVFPLRKGQKQPAVAKGFHAATTDEAQIAKWWGMWPEANIGIPTAGMLVLDIDGEGNPWLESPPGDLGNGPRSKTPRGRHYLYEGPGRNTTSKLALGVDTRGTGGYIVAPPSVVSDVHYEWEMPLGALQTPPAWLSELLAEEAVSRPVSRLTSETSGETIPSGQRNDTLARYAGAMRRTGMGEAAIAAALVVMGRDQCDPPLGDAECRAIAASVARYAPDEIAEAMVTGLADALDGKVEPAKPATPDPGPIPESMLSVPGFVDRVSEWSQATAPYPNPVLSFSAALCLQATLAGRKVRDAGNLRTNIYVLALANSATGKDHPRRVNARIMGEAGLAESVGDHFASGEGLEDALLDQPCMLFQTDEIDGLLRQSTAARDSRAEAIMGALLRFSGDAGGDRAVRKKAFGGKDDNREKILRQPHLVLLGTAIPKHYYEALTERMLTNGFFSRWLVLESPRRYPGRIPVHEPIPSDILATAQWWADLSPGGNLSGVTSSPQPLEIPWTPDARAMLDSVRVASEDEYSEAEARRDQVAMTVWGRVVEQTARLALVYACSSLADKREPTIPVEAIDWAHRLVSHQAKRMLWMASQHVSDGLFHAQILKLVRAIREGGGSLTQQQARTALRGVKAREFAEIVEAAISQGEITVEEKQTGGRPARTYSTPESR